MLKVISPGQSPTANIARIPGATTINWRVRGFHKPEFINGPVGDFAWVQDVEITPVDFSVYFKGAITEYAMSTIPTGLTLDSETGILSGTPTAVSGGQAFVTASNQVGSADTNIFAWNVSLP